MKIRRVLLSIVLALSCFTIAHAEMDVSLWIDFPRTPEDPGNWEQAQLFMIPHPAPANGPTYWTYNGGMYYDDGTNNTVGFYNYNNSAWHRFFDDVGGVGTPIWLGKHTINGGLSVGTSGVIESSVADGSSAVAFDNDWKVSTTTSGAIIYQIGSSTESEKYMAVSHEGEFAFGNSSTLAPQPNVVLGFVQLTSAGDPTWSKGVLAALNHESASKTPGNIFGVAGGVILGSSATTTTGNIFGVKGSYQASKDTTGSSALEISGVLSNPGAGAGSGTINNSTNGQNYHKGDWARMSSYRGGYWANGLVTAPTNNPAIATGITVDIPGASAITGKQYGVEVLASTNTRAAGNQANTPTITSAAIYAEFPNRTEDATHQNELAHVYLLPKAAASGGPAYWNNAGG